MRYLLFAAVSSLVLTLGTAADARGGRSAPSGTTIPSFGSDSPSGIGAGTIPRFGSAVTGRPSGTSSASIGGIGAGADRAGSTSSLTRPLIVGSGARGDCPPGSSDGNLTAFNCTPLLPGSLGDGR
jgi:hypothetical protein